MQLAEEKKLHVVELKEENDYYPTVVASPPSIRSEKEITSNEVMDFTQYGMGGKLVLKKKKFPPFYTKHWSWTVRQRKQIYHRNKDEVRLRMYAEHGELCSFLTEKYPEARPQYWSKKKKQAEEVM